MSSSRHASGEANDGRAMGPSCGIWPQGPPPKLFDLLKKLDEGCRPVCRVCRQHTDGRSRTPADQARPGTQTSGVHTNIVGWIDCMLALRGWCMHHAVVDQVSHTCRVLLFVDTTRRCSTQLCTGTSHG